MQQRFAFALLIRMTGSSSLMGQPTERLYGTVQAVDVPEVNHFTSLHQLSRWIESMLPAHISPGTVPVLQRIDNSK